MKRSELVLWYAPDGSYGVCQRHELGIIMLDDITDSEHDDITRAEMTGDDIISLLDKITFRIVNEDAKNVSHC